MMENTFKDDGKYISRCWKRSFKMMDKIFKDDGEHISGGKSNRSGHRSAPRPCQAHTINIALCVSQHRKLEKNFDSQPTLLFFVGLKWLRRPASHQTTTVGYSTIKVVVQKSGENHYSLRVVIILDFKTPDLALDVRLITLDSRP